MEIQFVPSINPSVNVPSSEILQAITSEDFWTAVNDTNLFPDTTAEFASKIYPLHIHSIHEVRSKSVRWVG